MSRLENQVVWLLRIAVIIALLTALAVVIGTPAFATSHGSAHKPQLSIAVDNGQTSAKAGDSLTYTVTIRNLGTTAVKNLRISQTVPTGLALVSSSPKAKVTPHQVGWRVHLKADAKTSMRTTMTVTKTRPDLLRLATVACAAVSAKAPPVVCATHSDQLPAGAAAAAAAAPSTSSGAASGAARWWYAAAGAVVLAVVLAGALLVARAVRRRRRAA